MKLYIYDHGWSGATMTFAKDRETANKILVDPVIEAERRSEIHHNAWYYVKESPLYEPDRHNPFVGRVEYMIECRDRYLKEYDIVEGVIIETEGE
jgi:hypothetical protein